MLRLWTHISTLISVMLVQRQPRRRSSRHDPIDWLPPVLGPHNWSVGIMADRSACWYFERDQA